MRQMLTVHNKMAERDCSLVLSRYIENENYMQVILLTHNCEGIFQISYPIRLQEHRYVRIESVLRKNESKNVHLNLNISNWTQARKPHILIPFALYIQMPPRWGG